MKYLQLLATKHQTFTMWMKRLYFTDYFQTGKQNATVLIKYSYFITLVFGSFRSLFKHPELLPRRMRRVMVLGKISNELQLQSAAMRMVLTSNVS
jgi:hypothetical protein